MSAVHYHRTTDLTPAQHIHAERQAKTQDTIVLGVFRTCCRPLSPSEVWAKCSDAGKRWPLTSVRRAISNLTRDGFLVKLENQREGLYGSFEHLWALPAGQGELFGGRAA